ncbi:MAG: M56 family metallopeptidase [Eubacterium sp.]|nr:M56 family metallopeptidase [Eubacterium sp.]
MMERSFISVLNMSLTGSLVILAVLIIRVFLRKAPRIFSYCLWAVALFRLLCPFSFTAAFSPLNALQVPSAEDGRIEYITEDILQYQMSVSPSVLPEENIITSVSHQSEPLDIGTLTSSELILRTVSGIWLAGIAVMTLYSAIALARLLKKLKTASWERDNIYISSAISTPFVIGLIRPRIYLPSTLGREEMRYILLHEQIHLKRGDHIVKIVSYVTLCLHWFNPFVWAAFFLSGKDMEMSCDEAVIRRIGSGVKKDYTTSLLCLSTGKRIVNGIPLAFGEGDTGSRIRNVLRYKKPAAFVMGGAAIVCAIAAVILLANPDRSADHAEPEERLTEYGVIMEVEADGVTRQMFISPWSGAREIPEAQTIDTYFEPGDTRDPHQLLPGDLAAITFASREDIEVQEDSPARYSGPAESITIMSERFSLRNLGSEPPSLLEGAYLLTFPGGVVPEVSTAKPGDILSLYWEENEDEAYLPLIPESSQSRLIASTPILAVTENEYGGKMLTVGLTRYDVFQMLAGFGFHIRFALNSGDLPDDTELQAAETAQAYLDSLNLQEQDAQTAPAEETMASPNTYYVNIRSVARSARVIDAYVADNDFPYDNEMLAFAENCVFQVNYSKDKIDYREVSFDDFADLIDAADHMQNKPCLLTFQDGLVTEARLLSAWFHYGISFDTFGSSASIYEYLLENEGEDAFDTYYSLVDTENMDISDREGIETIEVYTGNIGDGDSGIVLFKSAEGELLYTQDAHIARADWNNIYLGERDGVPFLMNVYIEDRWDYGGYGYWVYRLDEQGGIRQIVGTRFDFQLGDQDFLTYDDNLFREWVEGMTGWLADSHLILSSQEGEIRTEKVSDADLYDYDTLNLKDRES